MSDRENEHHSRHHHRARGHGNGHGGMPAENKPSSQPGGTAPRRQGPAWYRRPLLVGGLFLAVAAIAIGVTLFWLHSRRFESTDDASIDVVPQLVSAQLPGRVTRVDVQDNQDVAADTPLVELDAADFHARAEQARAAGAQATAQREEALAQREMFGAQREQAMASLTIAETTADNAARDLARLKGLRQDNAGAVSQQQWDNAEAAQKTAAARVEAARRAVSAAEAQVRYAGRLEEAARAAQDSAQAQQEEAGLNLSYMMIRSRVAGRIANLRVAPGNYVQPGTPLMAVVPREVYITANFKETQLVHMRRGQRVRVKIDAYPDLELEGRVDSLQPGTGQAFSTLPAENATGNWVKVVQRVPVRIALDRLPDDPERRLGPGMSVEVEVAVR